jgi:hypothetical protein
MNTLTTFTGLSAEIPIWTNRNDTVFINEVPNFINLAQQRVFIDCPTMASQQYVQGTFVPNNNIISVPGLWGSNLTFEYIDSATSDIVILQYVPIEYLQTFNPAADGISTESPLPRYYSNMSLGYLIISPTPTEAYSFQIAYDANNPQLSSSQQTNFITQNLYDVLFLASMYYAYVFLQNDTQSQSYEQRYKERIAGYLMYNSGRKNDRNADAMKD